MELKRFLLTADNNIYEKSKVFKSKDETQLLIDFGFQNTICIGEIIKTSDNILDLVEVGDLIGDETLIMVVKQYKNGIFYDLDSYTCQEGFVKYIYKLQPNGDYKRYEVN